MYTMILTSDMDGKKEIKKDEMYFAIKIELSPMKEGKQLENIDPFVFPENLQQFKKDENVIVFDAKLDEAESFVKDLLKHHGVGGKRLVRVNKPSNGRKRGRKKKSDAEPVSFQVTNEELGNDISEDVIEAVPEIIQESNTVSIAPVMAPPPPE